MRYFGGIEKLSKPVQQELIKYISPDEKIVICGSPAISEPTTIESLFGATILSPLLMPGYQLHDGDWLNAVVALENRLIVMDGMGYSGKYDFKVEVIEYLDISSIEVYYAGLSVNGSRKIEMPKRAKEELIYFSERLRELVRQFRKTHYVVEKNQAIPTDLILQLERLAQLHESGALSDDEFRIAKDKLLGQ